MTHHTTNESLHRALRFIATQQLTDGSFISLSSPKTNFTKAKTYQTTFVSSLILGALAKAPGAGAKNICNQLVAYIQSQQNPDGSYNYWSKTAPQYTGQPYPNDLDDTFCALISLQLYDPRLITAKAMAKIIKLLLATETKIGGPYRTWLVEETSPDIWLDVDVAVNANIGYFLKLRDIKVPNLTTFLQTALYNDGLRSPYYPSAHMIIYYYARFYERSANKQLAERIERMFLEDCTPLQDALLLTSYERLGKANSELANGVRRRLLARQQLDGSWPAEAFCIDPAIEGKTYYNGSAALTTAFVYEALTMQPTNKVRPVTPAKPYKKLIDRLHTKLGNHIDESLKLLLINSCQHILQTNNGQEIVGFVEGFANGLHDSGHYRPSQLNDLVLASLCGWVAYTIYDDFLDDEGQPRQLPLANIAMRSSLQAFYRAVPNSQKLVNDVFDKIDSANMWELKNCRFAVSSEHIVITKLPNYGDLHKLAERSYGHILPPLLLLQADGHDLGDKDFKLIQKVLEHYLIAKQLNDDLHDWQEDLEHGHCSYVVAILLKEPAIRPGQYKTSELIDRLKKYFWQDTLITISQEVKRQLADAQVALDAQQVLNKQNVLNDLIQKSLHSIETTLQEQAEAQEFLSQFKHPTK